MLVDGERSGIAKPPYTRKIPSLGCKASPDASEKVLGKTGLSLCPYVKFILKKLTWTNSPRLPICLGNET